MHDANISMIGKLTPAQQEVFNLLNDLFPTIKICGSIYFGTNNSGSDLDCYVEESDSTENFDKCHKMFDFELIEYEPNEIASEYPVLCRYKNKEANVDFFILDYREYCNYTLARDLIMQGKDKSRENFINQVNILRGLSGASNGR